MVEAVRREKISAGEKPWIQPFNVSYQGMDVRYGLTIMEKLSARKRFRWIMRASTPLEILSRKRKSYQGADLFASVIVRCAACCQIRVHAGACGCGSTAPAGTCRTLQPSSADYRTPGECRGNGACGAEAAAESVGLGTPMPRN